MWKYCRRSEKEELHEVLALVCRVFSYRQPKRVYSRYIPGGNSCLAHGLRSRRSNHLIGAERRQRILELYESKYGDFGPTLASEYLCLLFHREYD